MENIIRMATQRIVFKALIFMTGTIVSIYSSKILAQTYWYSDQSNIIGMVKSIETKWGDTLPTVGRRHSMGGEEMEDANPGIDYWQPKVGTRLLIPSRFVLPNAPREGIVVNLAEMRLYYFHPDTNKVTTFPVAIGKAGWHTPLGETNIVRKRKNPTWVVPQSIQEDRRKNNMPVFKTMPPGPKNPLGDYAMNLGFKNIVIHGTPWPLGVGLRSSHGCLRMMPEHIEQLYHMVDVGTKVNLIYQPNKIGFDGRQVYLEIHEDFHQELNQNKQPIAHQFKEASTVLNKQFNIDWKKVLDHVDNKSGYPLPVGHIH